MWNNIVDYVEKLPDPLWNLLIIIVAIAVGLLIKLILSLLLRLNAKQADYSFTVSVLRRLATPINFFLPLLVLNLMEPAMRLNSKQEAVADKILEILLTLSLAMLLIGIVKIVEDYVYHHYDLKKADNLRERKIRTQLQFIRKMIIGVIIFVTISLILLSFDSLRRLGAGLLTGVGVGGIIIGFAAQRSLANLLAGFQLAFTQPIRLDDVLVVEGEWGKVEEITLTYVVLLIWDERRLILPINYFIEKPFQNWTRTGSQLLGTVMLYLDYNVPIDLLRKEFLRLVQDNPLWDKRAAALQVTNFSERTVEVRCLISANNASKAFDLRCFLRENILLFIQQHYPESLPQTRIIINQPLTGSNESATNK